MYFISSALGFNNIAVASVQGRFGGGYEWKLKVHLGNYCHNPDEE